MVNQVSRLWKKIIVILSFMLTLLVRAGFSHSSSEYQKPAVSMMEKAVRVSGVNQAKAVSEIFGEMFSEESQSQSNLICTPEGSLNFTH